MSDHGRMVELQNLWKSACESCGLGASKAPDLLTRVAILGDSDRAVRECLEGFLVFLSGATVEVLEEPTLDGLVEEGKMFLSHEGAAVLRAALEEGNPGELRTQVARFLSEHDALVEELEDET